MRPSILHFQPSLCCLQIFGGPVIKSLQVYAGADAWGIRLQLNGNGGSLAAVGAILQFLHDYVDSKIPSQVDPVFSISGPTTGNGLPIAIGLGLTNVGFQKVSTSACWPKNCMENGSAPKFVKATTQPPPLAAVLLLRLQRRLPGRLQLHHRHLHEGLMPERQPQHGPAVMLEGLLPGWL